MESDSDTTMEEELFQQLFQQLTMCKRNIIDFSSALLEAIPTVEHRSSNMNVDPRRDLLNQPNFASTRSEVSLPSPPPINASALERELKEMQEACQDAERVAEDREEKLAALEQVLKDTTESLESERRFSRELKEKYEFQVEVSQRIARHYQSLQNSVSQFKELYQSLNSAMEQSRALFEHNDHKIEELEGHRRRLENGSQARRQKLADRENLVRYLEQVSAETLAKLVTYETRTTELQQQVEALEHRLTESEEQQKLQGSENIRLQELVNRQASILQKEQETISTLTESLNTMPGIQSTARSGEDDSKETLELEIVDLRGRVMVLQLQAEELSAQRIEALASHRSQVESIAKKCEDSEEQLQKALKKAQELEQENTDLRGLLARRTSSAASSNSPRPMMSSIMPSTTSAPKPSSKFALQPSINGVPAGFAASIQSPPRRNFQQQTPVRPTEDEIFDPYDEDDPSLLASPAFGSGSGLSLLSESSTELLQYRGLKCCGEPAIGLTVTCSSCQELFHVNCMESVRSSKSLGKNKKFICYACDPSSKAPKTRKPRLQVRT